MGAVGSKSKEPKPYPFSFPQHHPAQFYPGYQTLPPWAPGPFQAGYDEKTMSSMYPGTHRKKKKAKNQMMNPAMAMGWGQGYAPFPYPPATGYPMPPYMPGMMPGMMGVPAMQMPFPQPAPAAGPSASAPVIPPGMASSHPNQQPVIPPMATVSHAQSHASHQQPPPLFTPGDGAQLQSFPGAELQSPQPPPRMQTPFIRHPQNEESDESDDPTRPSAVPPPPILNNSGADLHRSFSHGHEPQSPPHSRQPNHSENIAAVLGNHTPPNAGVFGPPGGRPRTTTRNPLPPPPKDLYETTPYKTLLNLPQTDALLSAAYGNTNANPSGSAPAAPAASTNHAGPPPVIPGANAHHANADAKKKGRGFGLFRSLTSGGTKHRPMDVPSSSTWNAGAGPSRANFHPVFAPASHARRASADHLPRSQVPTTPDNNPPHVHQTTPSTAIPPNPVAGSHIPTLDPSAPPVRFTQSSPLAGFLNHSPHRVMYQNTLYPSATHLFEAMKYLQGGPGQQPRLDLAERIRTCGDVLEVYPLSAEFQSKGYVRSDWGLVYESCMDEVLYQKFRQHPNLRGDLMRTGMSQIIYEDPSDDYWGTGPNGDGANQLGIALVKVRARLRAEGYGI